MKEKSIVWSLSIACLLLLGLFLPAEVWAPADNRREFDHVGNFNFVVEIEGTTWGHFIDVSGGDSEVEVITYKNSDELGERKRPGRMTYSNIVLERGYVDTHDLLEWREQVIKGDVEPSRSGAIVLYSNGGQELARYNFFGAWPCKHELTHVVQQGGRGADINVKRVELVVEEVDVEFTRLPRAEGRSPNLKYELLLDGEQVGAFENVGLSLRETEVIEYLDEKDTIVRKRPGRTTYANVVLERGFIHDKQVRDWIESVVSGEEPIRKSGSIVLRDNNGDVIARWTFEEAWPCRWEGPNFDRSATGEVREILEIAVERIHRV